MRNRKFRSTEIFQPAVPGKGKANGVATLDSDTKVPLSQMPSGTINTYKGQYAASSNLITAYPTAALGDYAYVTGSNSYWYWNAALATAAWVNQEINEAAYRALSSAAISAVPYIVGV